MEDPEKDENEDELEENTESDDKHHSSLLDIQKKAFQEMEMFLDIPMTVSAELGQAKITIREILALETGTVLELTKLVGEPMELFINGLMIARGEVVVVNEKFGVRVTDVVDELEERRVASLTE